MFVWYTAEVRRNGGQLGTNFLYGTTSSCPPRKRQQWWATSCPAVATHMGMFLVAHRKARTATLPEGNLVPQFSKPKPHYARNTSMNTLFSFSQLKIFCKTTCLMYHTYDWQSKWSSDFSPPDLVATGYAQGTDTCQHAASLHHWFAMYRWSSMNPCLQTGTRKTSLPFLWLGRHLWSRWWSRGVYCLLRYTETTQGLSVYRWLTEMMGLGILDQELQWGDKNNNEYVL